MSTYKTFDAELHLTNGEIITVIDVNRGVMDCYKADMLSEFARNKNIIKGMGCTLWNDGEVLLLPRGYTNLDSEVIINVNQISYITKKNERDV